MKSLVDENVHLAIFHFLKDQGFDVISIAKDYSSLEDLEILSIANKEKRVIITNDKDFGYLAYHLNLPHQGIILFRLKSEQPEVKINRLKVLFKRKIDLSGHFTVITEEKIRIKGSKVKIN